MRNVVLGFLGTQLDQGKRAKWKPSVSLCADPDFPVDRMELLYDHAFTRLVHAVAGDIAAASPDTEVLPRRLDLTDPWDLEEVYAKLFDFARGYGFDEDRERYYLHLTTGTHVCQICWFLLAEARHIPAALIQTAPPRGERPPKLDVIDLDLRRYDALQARFDLLAREHGDALKGGIPTADPAYNDLIDRIETVVSASDAPVLLTGESGTGKSDLARRIHDLKLDRRRVKGRLVTVPCGTLRGEAALPALFGQRRGHLGIAGTERAGLLREADGGTLLLDDVDALGPGGQAALAAAIETGRYLPLGSDAEATSRFHVIATASADLDRLAAEGRFRPDLLARLRTWTFHLPPLRARPRDVEPNLRHELARAERATGARTGFATDAWEAWLRFARAPGTPWPGNFRDLGASVTRLTTLAPRGRITRAQIDEEIATLRRRWAAAAEDPDALLLADLVEGPVDPFDLPQLAHAIRTCRASASLAEAGRTLFAVSREAKASRNDGDRLRKYLARFGLDWETVQTR